MRILFVFEDNKGSANYNIVIKLAAEMSGYHEVFGCYCFSENVHDTESEHSFRDSIRIGNYNNSLYEELETYGWRAKSVSQKITFLLAHPFIMYKYVSHRIIHGKKLVEYSDRVLGFIKERKINTIIGFTNPYTIAGFIASLDISCKKAVFQMDPYSSYQYLSGSERLKRQAFERDTLKGIDMLFTTSLIIKDLNDAGVLEEDSAKPTEIEFPLINTDEQKRTFNGRPILDKKPGKYYFLHAGTLIETIRNPKILADIFERLPEDYILVLAGRGADLMKKYDRKIRHRIINLGMVSSEDANKLKDEADFLISFNNLTYNMVPSKLFECLDSGKPFLNICQLDNCPTIPYVRDYENACMIFKDKIQPEEITSFVETAKGHLVEHSKIAEKYRACTIRYVAGLIEGNMEHNIS